MDYEGVIKCTKFMKQTNWMGLLPICIFLLPACQTVSSPKMAVESYLVALSNGNPQLGQEYRCFPSENYDDFPPNVKAWKIVTQEPRSDKYDPDSHYNAVLVSIESMSVGGFLVTRTWETTVWNSNDFFEFQKRYSDKTQQNFADAYEVLNKNREFLEGSKSVVSPPPSFIPDRTKISSKPYCITRMKKAGTD